MRIFIDIGHPAHVHYFKNFIRLMQKRGHEFFLSARNKDVTFHLLKSYDFPYSSRGAGGTGILGKLLYLFKGDFIILKLALKFKPDIFLSFASPYAAHASFFLGKPHIAFDDTEAAKFGQMFYRPFTNTILTPQSFKKTFSKKQIRFNGYMELCSLHPKYFTLNKKIMTEEEIPCNKPIVLFRFVSWDANHDMGQKGFSDKDKKEIVLHLSKMYTVLISSESSIPAELKEMAVNIEADKIHQLMGHASLFIGEGATMASECVMLGTPAIYVNSISSGTIEEQEKYGLLYQFINSDGVLKKATQLLSNPDLKKDIIRKKNKMLEDKIDVVEFMIWFIENYPTSFKTMKKNPDYQYIFK